MKLIIFILLLTGFLQAQLLVERIFKLNATEAEIFNGSLYGNGIVDIVTNDSILWAATGYGLNRTVDGGVSWENFDSRHYIGKGGVAAAHQMDENTLWISTAFDTVATDEEMSAGGGLSYTRDQGATWTHVRQPVDAVDEDDYKPTTTNISNITYDIANLDSTIWITSWAGGLRKSSDMGKTWAVVTIDGNPFWALEYLTHRAFSVMTENGNLWVGTAGGIGKSADGGESFKIFTHQDGQDAISGNFVVAFGYQEATNTVWAATIEATDTSEYRAVSKTSNGGTTWQVVLPGVFAHNFTFDGSRIFVACDEGLFISDDDGENWYKAPPIRDYESGDEIFRDEYYSVNVLEYNSIKRLWAGSSDGLAYTEDNGNSWKVIRSYVSTAVRPQPAAYAYPSPFSPSRHYYARFEYNTENARQVDIKIYDFAMDMVKKIPIDDLKPKWDGTNEAGAVVASGIYIYRVEIDGQVTWGKIAVIN